MTTITIPKEITKDDLVIIPRGDYERLLSIVRKYSQIDEDLNKALSQVRKGRVVGPFTSAKELRASLEK